MHHKSKTLPNHVNAPLLIKGFPTIPWAQQGYYDLGDLNMINKISNQPSLIDISMTLNTITYIPCYTKKLANFFLKKRKRWQKKLNQLYDKKNTNYPYIFPNFWLKKWQYKLCTYLMIIPFYPLPSTWLPTCHLSMYGVLTTYTNLPTY